jgi:hypothetical protein
VSDAPGRADRLAAAVLVCGLVREPATTAMESAAEAGLLTPAEWEAWRSLDDEDIRIAHACLEAEYGRRLRQWRALDDFLAAWETGVGDGRERIESMPPEEAHRFMLAAYELGWTLPFPEDRE